MMCVCCLETKEVIELHSLPTCVENGHMFPCEKQSLNYIEIKEFDVQDL